jgi:hypothetical protein
MDSPGNEGNDVTTTETRALETEDAVPPPDRLPPRSLLATAITLAVVAALSCAVILGTLVLKSRPHHTGISATEQNAVDAAGQLVVNLTTYTRANFDKDWQLAVSGLTGSLAAQEQAEKAPTLAALQQGKFDVRGTVVDTAVASSSGDNVQLLMVQQGYRVSDGKSVLTSISRLTVTATKVGSKWLLSTLTNVPLA